MEGEISYVWLLLLFVPVSGALIGWMQRLSEKQNQIAKDLQPEVARIRALGLEEEKEIDALNQLYEEHGFHGSLKVLSVAVRIVLAVLNITLMFASRSVVDALPVFRLEDVWLGDLSLCPATDAACVLAGWLAGLTLWQGALAFWKSRKEKQKPIQKLLAFALVLTGAVLPIFLPVTFTVMYLEKTMVADLLNWLTKHMRQRRTSQTASDSDWAV